MSSAYKLWHSFLPHIPKTSRYSLGQKIDVIFLEILESIFAASCLDRQQKLPYIKKAIIKLDSLKFFLQIIWEIKALDNKKYVAISEQLNEVGKMLGGWCRYVIKENPA